MPYAALKKFSERQPRYIKLQLELLLWRLYAVWSIWVNCIAGGAFLRPLRKGVAEDLSMQASLD